MQEFDGLPKVDGPANARQTILICDYDRLLAEALESCLEHDFRVSVVYGNEELFSRLRTYPPPDLLLLGVRVFNPSDLETIASLHRAFPSLRILAHSVEQESMALQKLQTLGAGAFFHRGNGLAELVEKVKRYAAGETFRSGDLSSQDPECPLSARQLQVLSLIAAGASAKDIANDLNISVRTAEFHRSSIMQRLNMRSTAQLTRYALSYGVLENQQSFYAKHAS